ncbi:MAG: serine--tRNA ligase [Candidatus Susulua stagnicola]|nr:serine--tRNA ligase [Candidatus Susulua stagnicola]
MLDIKLIRQNPDQLREALEKRNSSFDLEGFLALDKERRKLIAVIEELSAAQNKIDREVKALLKEKKDPKPKIEEAKGIKKNLAELSKKFEVLNISFLSDQDKIPNIPHSSLPIGGTSKNKIIKESGKVRKFKFKPQDHIALAENLDIIDFKRAAKITGSNFTLFKGMGAKLKRALINFMLDIQSNKNGYKEVSPPKIVNAVSMRATGQLPNLKDDMYDLGGNDPKGARGDFYLIPTAEVPITNIHREEILNEKDLPIKYASYTPCFRREAGSYGKDTRGLVRVHEFDKIELVKFAKPEDSYDELEKLLKDACHIIELLKIPYRILLLATGDISFAAAKCYDIEIYAAGLDKWLEVSSCSNFEDFQARRGNIRYRAKSDQKLKFVHTLNGSGVALPRLIVAILENYQEKDGTVTVPKVLRKYLNGRKRITK